MTEFQCRHTKLFTPVVPDVAVLLSFVFFLFFFVFYINVGRKLDFVKIAYHETRA